MSGAWSTLPRGGAGRLHDERDAPGTACRDGDVHVHRHRGLDALLESSVRRRTQRRWSLIAKSFGRRSRLTAASRSTPRATPSSSPFRRAAGAIEAAIEAQRSLQPGPIRVRIGLHTGNPHVSTDGYVGHDVHLGARVASAGHGGQVLLTKATADSAGATDTTDLGEHRVTDFDAPVWIYQLGDCQFPPLKTISNTNLPRPA